MNNPELQKELQKHLKEGASPSEILKGIKKDRGNIPTPPPMPKIINGVNQKTFNLLLEAGLTEDEIKKK